MGTAMNILVLNSGSSSVKYEVIDTETEHPLVRGQIERIGAGGAILTQTRRSDGRRIKESSPVGGHAEAIRAILALIVDPDRGALGETQEIHAVGHRVVHGGERFKGSILIDDEVEDGIRDCMELAPLHNPHNLSGIRAARAVLPTIPHVAVFDTAFHATLPPEAFHYAIPLALYRRYGIRRYGFHGTSHRNVGRRAGLLLQRDPTALNLISFHLGNGSSACAIREGRSVDTSMGFTPLEGLVMGTRSGDLDPAALLHVMAKEDLSVADADALLNRHAGLRGLSGISGDMRDLLEEEAAGDPRARLALSVYTYRAKKYLGAYAAVLGRVDAIAFTGGVGENSPLIRERILAGLELFGVEVDPEANASLSGGREGSFHRGRTPLLVIRSGEELTIARETVRILGLPTSGN
jgi:acetate kinase